MLQFGSFTKITKVRKQQMKNIMFTYKNKIS